MKHIRFDVSIIFVMCLMAFSAAWSGELHDAVKANEIDLVREIVERGVPINGEDESGISALYWTAREGKISAVELLVTLGADVNYVCDKCNGSTPLISAAYRGQHEVVDYLATHGANLDAEDKDGYTALSWAWKMWRMDAVKSLIRHGANVNVPPASEYGPSKSTQLILHGAFRGAGAGYDDELVELIVTHGADVNARDATGETPLHAAAYHGNLNAVKLLLEYKADVNASAYKFKLPTPMGDLSSEGATPLHSAVAGMHLDVVKLLVNYRASLQARSSGSVYAERGFVRYSGLTPLELAEFLGKYRSAPRAEYRRIAGYLRSYLETGGSLHGVDLAIKAYAADLRKHGRAADTQRVEQNAMTFGQTLDATESVYLGFDPSALLNEYAAFLRSGGQTAKAGEMQSLAVWYFHANIAAATKSARKYKQSKDDFFDEDWE